MYSYRPGEGDEEALGREGNIWKQLAFPCTPPSHCIHLWMETNLVIHSWKPPQQIPTEQILNVHLEVYPYIWTQNRINFLSVTEMIWKTDILLQTGPGMLYYVA